MASDTRSPKGEPHLASMGKVTVAARGTKLMVSDTLVERLRVWRKSEFGQSPAGYMFDEAADRMEALEAENADLKRRLDNICMSIHTCTGDECERPICIANRKNKALEAALRRMVYETTHLSPMKPNGDHDCTIKADALEQARRALEGKAHD